MSKESPQEQMIAELQKKVDLLNNALEQAQHEKDFLRKEIIANLPGYIVWKNEQGQYLGSNQHAAHMAGLEDCADIIGKTDYDLSWKEQANNILRDDRSVFETGKSHIREEEVLLPDGCKVAYISERKLLNNEILLIVSIDISEQKRLEEANMVSVEAYETHRNKASTDNNKKSVEIMQSASTNKNTGASILIVEDNTTAAMAVCSILDELGYQTLLASNGFEAVEAATHHDLDLILMDIGLPDISGIEATKQIRALDDIQHAHVPIVALTWHGNDPHMSAEALSAGMQDILTKPTSPNALKAILVHYTEPLTIEAQDSGFSKTDKPHYRKVIDWNGCVAQCNSNPEFAREMLSVLADDLKKTETMIARHYVNEDEEALRAELHRIRGGICYLKLPELDEAFKNFHDAVKAKPRDQDKLEQTYKALQQAITHFFEAVKKYLS